MAKNSLLTLVLALWSVGCAPMAHVDPRPFKSTDAEIRPYVAEVEQLLNITAGTNIGFVDELEKESVGVCYIKVVPIFNDAITYKWILIKRGYWNKATDRARLSLIIHELLHCDYNIPHNNALRTDYCHESLMHESQPSDYCLHTHWDSYLSEWQ